MEEKALKLGKGRKNYTVKNCYGLSKKLIKISLHAIVKPFMISISHSIKNKKFSSCFELTEIKPIYKRTWSNYEHKLLVLLGIF